MPNDSLDVQERTSEPQQPSMPLVLSRTQRALGVTLGSVLGAILGGFIALVTDQSWQVPVIALTAIGVFVGYRWGTRVVTLLLDSVTGL